MQLSDNTNTTRVMLCPVCGGDMDYVPNGDGHIMHAHPGDAGCLFNLPVGKMSRAEALEIWANLYGTFRYD